MNKIQRTTGPLLVPLAVLNLLHSSGLSLYQASLIVAACLLTSWLIKRFSDRDNEADRWWQ